MTPDQSRTGNGMAGSTGARPRARRTSRAVPVRRSSRIA